MPEQKVWFITEERQQELAAEIARWRTASLSTDLQGR